MSWDIALSETEIGDRDLPCQPLGSRMPQTAAEMSASRTIHRSIAAIAFAWLRRNVLQLCGGGVAREIQRRNNFYWWCSSARTLVALNGSRTKLMKRRK
jgi:hypothetical protein